MGVEDDIHNKYSGNNNRQSKNAEIILSSISNTGNKEENQSKLKGRQDTISYQPHYRTLTDAGKSHFRDISYAVSDLVDNSIQATYDQEIALIKKRFNVETISFSTAKQLELLNLEGLIIHDEKDNVIPYEDALLINKSLKNSKLITTSGLGHSMNDESISNHIYEFLEN